MNYNLYTGFVKSVNPTKYANKDSQEFFNLWYNNTRKFAGETDILILGPDAPVLDSDKSNIKVLDTYDNLGHVDDYVYGKRHGKWCGWTSAVVFGMMHAYMHNVDFIYKEQDCLAFGNYIERMYEESSDSDIIYGSCQVMGAAQSLFLAKRNAIPDIIGAMSVYPDGLMLPEAKFANLPVKQKRFSFGYDRDRPWNPSDSVFYIQQVTVDDLEQLKYNNLV
jgi:hypothetical protein